MPVDIPHRQHFKDLLAWSKCLRWCFEQNQISCRKSWQLQSMPISFIYLFLIEFIAVTLVNPITWVRSVRFHNTSSVYCITYSPPWVKSPSVTVYPPCTLFYFLPHPLPSGCHHTAVCVQGFFFLFLPLLNPLTFFTHSHNPLPSNSCQSVLYPWICFWFVY